MANRSNFPVSDFLRRHPWGLSDGRRFASLYAAIGTIQSYGSENRKGLALLPVTDHRTGAIYTLREIAVLQPENPWGEVYEVSAEDLELKDLERVA